MPEIKVARVEDIPPGSKKTYRASNTRVLIVNVDGKLYGIQPVCSHVSNPLAPGKLRGKVIYCDKHFASFDVTTGEAVDLPPGLTSLDPIRTYPVRIDGGDVIVSVPE